MRNRKTRQLAQAALFTALIFVCITYLHVPNGFGGIIHFGDGLIFLAGTLLPLPYAMMAASLGAGLMNFVVGSPFLFFTLLIKPLLPIFFDRKSAKILSKRNAVAPFFAAGTNTVLYIGANAILGGRGGAVQSVPGLLIQGGLSVVFFFVLAVFLDTANFKRRFI